jgi:hypothetical protein
VWPSSPPESHAAQGPPPDHAASGPTEVQVCPRQHLVLGNTGRTAPETPPEGPWDGWTGIRRSLRAAADISESGAPHRLKRRPIHPDAHPDDGPRWRSCRSGSGPFRINRVPERWRAITRAALWSGVIDRNQRASAGKLSLSLLPKPRLLNLALWRRVPCRHDRKAPRLLPGSK